MLAQRPCRRPSGLTWRSSGHPKATLLCAAYLYVMRLDFYIRTGAADDAERLAALGVQVWLHTYATEGISQDIARYALEEFTAAKMSALLARDSTVVLVADSQYGIIGYAVAKIGAVCESNPRVRVELETLYVQEHFARQSVGSRILGRAEVLARERTGSALWLMVNAANFPAIEFYASHGYTKVGTAYFKLGEARYENHVLIGKDAQPFHQPDVTRQAG